MLAHSATRKTKVLSQMTQLCNEREAHSPTVLLRTLSGKTLRRAQTSTNLMVVWYSALCKNTSCANGFVTLLVLRLACLSDVKVVFWHVSEHVNLQVSVSWYKLVT